MAKVHGPIGEATGPRELDVVGAQHLSISLRTRRMINVIGNSDNVTAGKTSARNPPVVRKPVVHQPIAVTSPRPYEGSHCSVTANMRINGMPIGKFGSDTPISDTVSKNCDSQLSRRSAV